MKIAWITNSTTQETGFGQQAKLVTGELRKRGHQNILLCRPHTNQNMEYEEIHIEDYRWPAFESELARIRPDAVIVFEGHHLVFDCMDMQVTPANCPVYFWLPFEGSKVPLNLSNIFNGVPESNIIHLSEFALDLWGSGKVIAHSCDPAYRPLDTPKQELRKKWAKKFKIPILHDSFLLFNVNRNFFHKGWDNLFDLVARLKSKGVDVQLLCHTTPVWQENHGGFDLPQVAALFGITDEVMFTSGKLSHAEMNELYNMADLRVDMSHGEGFGLTAVECAKSHCPQIVTDHTTMREILGDTAMIIPPASYSYRMGTLWADPDVAEMDERITQTLESGGFGRVEYTDNPRFQIETIADQWEQTLSQPYNGWRDYRYGYHESLRVRAVMQSAARLAKLMKWKVLEIGAYDGEFSDWCVKFGVKYRGIEIPENLGNLNDRVRPVVNVVRNYGDPWPDGATAIVLHGTDNILGNVEGSVATDILGRIQEYNHVMFLPRPCFKWGTQRFNPDQLRDYLKAAGLENRTELRLLTKKQLPSFEHEVWSNSDVIPKELKG